MIGLLLNIPKKCKCCNRVDKSVRAWCCQECFFIWYDCGLTESDKIGRYCLHAEKNGYWPFDIHKQMPEEEFKKIVLCENAFKDEILEDEE